MRYNIACILIYDMLRLSYTHNAPICPIYRQFLVHLPLLIFMMNPSLLQYESEIIQAHTPHSYTLTHTLRIPVRMSPVEEVVSEGHLKF